MWEQSLSVWPVSDWWFFSCVWLHWIPVQLIPENSPSREGSSHSCVSGPPQCTQPSSLCFGAERTEERTFSLLLTLIMPPPLCCVSYSLYLCNTLYYLFSFKKIFFFFGVDHFYSLYWISYNIASVCYVCIFWPQGTWDLSFLTRDWTLSPCIGRWSLNHWTAREVPIYLTFNLLVTLTQFVF